MFIYTLSSSENIDIVRYVGYTSKKITKRLNEHLSESNNCKTHKDKWIQKVIRNNNSIIIQEIDSASNIIDLKNKEINYISLYKSFSN